MTRRAILALAPAAALKANPPAISMRRDTMRVTPADGSPTLFYLRVELDIADPGVRAFEVLASWRLDTGLEVARSVIATRGEHGIATCLIPTGQAADFHVQAWALRRQEQASA